MSVVVSRSLLECVFQSFLFVFESFSRYVAHSTSAECREGDWNAYAAYKMICDGQSTKKAVFYPSQKSLVPVYGPRMDGSLVGLSEETPDREPGIRCTLKPARPQTAPPRIPSSLYAGEIASF